MSTTRAPTTAPTIEVRELDGQFYASSPTAGWYLVRLEDPTHAPFCECPWHEHKLRGTKVDCKHLVAVRAYIEARKHSCPCCGQQMPKKREPTLSDAELEELFR